MKIRKRKKKKIKENIIFGQDKNKEISKYSFNANNESKNKTKEKFIYILEPENLNSKGRSFDGKSLEKQMI